MALKGFTGFEGFFISGLLIVLFTGCWFVDDFIYGEHDDDFCPFCSVPQKVLPQFNLTPQANGTPQINETANNTAKTEAQWNGITNDQAQKGCLRQAKKVAVDDGYPESFIFDCTCAAQETNATKTYNCNVATADFTDPNKPVQIYCVKAQNQCIVTAEGNTYSYNFDELEAFANGK
jgi:hypothetical protein